MCCAQSCLILWLCLLCWFSYFPANITVNTPGLHKVLLSDCLSRKDLVYLCYILNMLPLKKNILWVKDTVFGANDLRRSCSEFFLDRHLKNDCTYFIWINLKRNYIHPADSIKWMLLLLSFFNQKTCSFGFCHQN